MATLVLKWPDAHECFNKNVSVVFLVNFEQIYQIVLVSFTFDSTAFFHKDFSLLISDMFDCDFWFIFNLLKCSPSRKLHFQS